MKMGVYVQKFGIHGKGLFAREYIEAFRFIIEYTGESISNDEDKLREAREKEQNKVLSYRFRIDKHTVIDGDSTEGNDSRFINHSCKPNSRARVISLNRRKHIIIYARRGIQIGEEITSNYNFDREINDLDRIECSCGEKACGGFLN
jgi:SET domain-containing protein